MDNDSAHKHKADAGWRKGHRRWTFHFTPTSRSWTDAVEGFFGKLARRRPRLGVYDSLDDLEVAILDFIELHNEKETKQFKWTASLKRLVAARQRGFQMTRTSHYPTQIDKVSPNVDVTIATNRIYLSHCSNHGLQIALCERS